MFGRRVAEFQQLAGFIHKFLVSTCFMEKNPSSEAVSLSWLIMKFPTSYGICNFINLFRRFFMFSGM
jgi:hypothetical protein